MYLFRREGLACEVIAAGIKAFLSKISVHAQKVLHLFANEERLNCQRRKGVTCFFSMIFDMWACSAALKLEKSIIYVEEEATARK